MFLKLTRKNNRSSQYINCFIFLPHYWMIEMKIKGRLSRMHKKLLLTLIILGSISYIFMAKVRRSYRRKTENAFDLSTVGQDQVYLWTVDFHVSPIACNADLLEEIGVKVHAEVDFANCIFKPEFCRQRLKVLAYDNWRGFSLDPCPYRLRRDFFNAYANDPEFKRLDAVICSHPVANCELFIPFNKSLIVYATTRLEFGRYDVKIDWRQQYLRDLGSARDRWKEWLINLMVLASNPRNIIAANSVYDAKYIEYFTGIKALYIPSWCGSNALYPSPNDSECQSSMDDKLDCKRDVILKSSGPFKETIIIGPYRNALTTGWKHPLGKSLKEALLKKGIDRPYERMKDLYPDFKSIDVFADHEAMVFIPYQVSVMSFFEFYRLCIPIYVPSQELLIEWDQAYEIVSERMYGNAQREDFIIGQFEGRSTHWSVAEKIDEPFMPDHLKNVNVGDLPNPNEQDSFSKWIQFSDMYVFPCIRTFSSWSDLIQQIEVNQSNGEHEAMRSCMYNFSKQQRDQLANAWKRIFDRIKVMNAPGTSMVPETFTRGILNFYQGHSETCVNQLTDKILTEQCL